MLTPDALKTKRRKRRRGEGATRRWGEGATRRWEGRVEEQHRRVAASPRRPLSPLLALSKRGLLDSEHD